MHKAYDTILQSEVSANLAAHNSEFEPYRYECACCGEEVYIAAARSIKMATHFKHRNGNNDVECENYLGQYGVINIDSRSRRSNRERAEFYYDNRTKTFRLGLCFSENEIQGYEQQNSVFELRATASERPFFVLKISNRYFAPDTPTLIPMDKFSYKYYLSNTVNGIKREYELFKSGNSPVFFKLQNQDGDFKAKLIRSTVLYTNVQYFFVTHSQYSTPIDINLPSEIQVKETLCFETMGRKFLGKVLVINDKTPRLDALLTNWGYQLERSEILTLLWPPAAVVNDVSIIYSDYAFLYSTFELQAHGNINVRTDSISKISNGISKVLVKPRIKVSKKNTEIVIDRGEQSAPDLDVIVSAKSTTNTLTVPDSGSFFLFNHSGVKPLTTGQVVSLTPQSEVRCYYFGYYTGRIRPQKQDKLTGELLLKDILAHCKREDVFDKSILGSCVLSKTASQYIDECEASGLINPVAKQFIEEGRI